jgi:hypothetical protein
VYHTMLRTLVSISNSISWVPVGGLALRVLLVALDEWFRKSELSGDRAGLLVGQDAGAALRVHAILAGATDPDEMDVSGFLDQAVEYDRGGDIRDSFLKLMHLGGRSHPLAAVRAAELQKWAAGPEYRAILSGDYPRRGDDADAAMSDEARAVLQGFVHLLRRPAVPVRPGGRWTVRRGLRRRGHRGRRAGRLAPDPGPGRRRPAGLQRPP